MFVILNLQYIIIILVLQTIFTLFCKVLHISDELQSLERCFCLLLIEIIYEIMQEFMRYRKLVTTNYKTSIRNEFQENLN